MKKDAGDALIGYLSPPLETVLAFEVNGVHWILETSAEAALSHYADEFCCDDWEDCEDGEPLVVTIKEIPLATEIFLTTCSAAGVEEGDDGELFYKGEQLQTLADWAEWAHDDWENRRGVLCSERWA